MKKELNEIEKAAISAMSYDPITEAEKITGSSYKKEGIDGEVTKTLGVSLQINNVAEKNGFMNLLDDTPFSCKTTHFLRIVKEEGFKEVYSEKFQTKYDVVNNEMFYIFYHEDGIILVMDTFHGNRNSAHIYFNLDCDKFPSCRGGSMGFSKDGKTCVASFDVREGFRLTLKQLRNHGTFIKPWKETPFLWFLHHEDTKDDKYDYVAINKRLLLS